MKKPKKAPAKKAKKKAKKKAPAKKAKKAPAKRPVTAATPPAPGCPVVGIGASAGGLEALQAFLKALPAKPGLAVVIVVHLDAKRISMLPELLQTCTALPVHQVLDDTPVERDQVYVAPPGHNLAINAGVLSLTPQGRSGAPPLPIDLFFRSLAEDQGPAAVCVVLSGTGSDGTLGLRAIKGEGGMAMVQDGTARYDGMPRSATGTGLADYELSPDAMPAQLLSFLQSASRHRTSTRSAAADLRRASHKIVALLKARTGHDFALYKPTTLMRRIERRMSVHLLDDVERYHRYLTKHDDEVHTLFRELLIGVTSFFRDAAAFDALGAAITSIVERREDDAPLRLWSAGCSTGEEAYSLAILAHERVEAAGRHLPIQVFGTDLDAAAVDAARAGHYPASIQADLGPERLRRGFTRGEDGSYRVSRAIRELVVFAVQDITRDAPFSRLDLLSCRNLLIYLNAEVQARLLSVFHYSLRPGGLLFLGSSETVGSSSDLFRPVDRRWKVFSRQPLPPSRAAVIDLPAQSPGPSAAPTRMPASPPRGPAQSNQLLRALLLQGDTPPCAVIDQAMNVVFIHGRTGRFLEPPEGEVNVNILEMARPGLRTGLATCVRKVVGQRQEASMRGITLRSGGEELTLDLVARPILEPVALAGLSAVFFQTQSIEAVAKRRRSRKAKKGGEVAETAETADAAEVRQLRRQLEELREDLQTTIEELETSNEELKSTNEELQSTNEELQSSNEELQTSREELQSLNEESTTVNAELQSRIEAIGQVNDDLKNLLDSTGVATVFLDIEHNVRRFTPGAVALIPLTTKDVGRPINHFATTLQDVDFVQLAGLVLDDLVIQEREVQTADGRYYLLRVRPYRTTQNVIDGTVMTFEERTEVIMARQVLKQTTGARSNKRRR